MKPRKLLLLFLALLVALAISGRLYARHAAGNFGKQMGGAFRVVGREGFADTAALRQFFAEPAMTGYVRRVQQLSFLGGQYEVRLSELQQGMIYLSEQMSLPPPQRFSAPPRLKYFTIESDDHSDAGLAAAATALIVTYQSQL